MSEYAPIVLFCYKRPGSTIQTIESLKNNALAKDSTLYIFSDGPKNKDAEAAVGQVREYLKTVTGFRQVRINESPVNKGLAKSVISGVSTVINEHGKVIVLEDDLLLAPDFLTFMNAALDEYEHHPTVYSISGFIFDMPLQQRYAYDVFFTKRHCSWGWAIWKDRWDRIDWEVKDFAGFDHSAAQKKAFSDIGSDLPGMLQKQMTGKIDSWAIRCVYHQFKAQTYTVYPVKSKVVNTGFGADATHTRVRFNRYKATLDPEAKEVFRFPGTIFEDAHLLKKFTGKYSMPTRLYYYVLNRLLTKV
jgi:hypothetical protein